ncbi:MptD family putative ECF transporter S component [Anaerosphaera multitolerans]|uniref:Trep_Strep domain-containing protein n=1 Tax=Anaerosphaera multitolerans TaxID=2487351 RepID=A0A437S5Z6_9FIRM|nr:MptD family putative ECF transporter S component [Anaerosphaera multitolerans]RVU54441.1 Trep_Strep domain-containing protein [Anaerosphaera multitolerans]
MNRKLKMKDYIFAGAFAAIFIVVVIAVMAISSFNPLGQIVGSIIMPVIAAPVFFLYVTKVPKRGALLILGILLSLIMMSSSIIPLFICVGAGIIGDILASIGNYKSKKLYSLAYGFFGLAMMSPYSTLLVAREDYINNLVKFYGEGYATTFNSYISTGALIGIFIAGFIAALIGAYLAQKLLKKNFNKAGII